MCVCSNFLFTSCKTERGTFNYQKKTNKHAATNKVTHFSFAQYQMRRRSERAINLLIFRGLSRLTAAALCSATNEGEIVIINIQIYCFGLSWGPGGGSWGGGRVPSDLFPLRRRSISNWTFLMINWATLWRGLTPRSPMRNFRHL